MATICRRLLGLAKPLVPAAQYATRLNECKFPICGVEVRQAPASSIEKCAVAEFLKTNFFPDDPVLKAAGFDPDKPDPALVDFFVQMMNDRITYYAQVQESKQIMGILIGHVTTPTTIHELKILADRLRNDTARRYIHYLAQLEERANVYTMMNVDKLLKIEVLCTARPYRRRGVCKQLLKHIRDLVEKERSFDAIRVDTGSIFSAKGAKKLPEMKSWSKKLLPTFKDDRGVPWIKNDVCPPHREIEVIVANMRPPKRMQKKELVCEIYGRKIK